MAASEASRQVALTGGRGSWEFAWVKITKPIDLFHEVAMCFGFKGTGSRCIRYTTETQNSYCLKVSGVRC